MLNLIILCIYAVLAVDFFRHIYSNCTDPELYGNHFELSVTKRGMCFGMDYYGTFARSLFSLFQVLTGESWSEAAVRPVLWYYEDSFFETLGSSLFFISFMIVNAVVLINVVVAVLIDGMSKPTTDENEGDVEVEDKDDEDVNQPISTDSLKVKCDPAEFMQDTPSDEGVTIGLTETPKASNKDWFREWMNPHLHIPKHHKRTLLMGKDELSTKVAALRTEALNLRAELEATTADMRLQLQEVLSAVRDTLQEERRLSELDEVVENGAESPVYIDLDSEPSIISAFVGLAMHNGNSRASNGDAGGPTGNGNCLPAEGHKPHQANENDTQRPGVLQDDHNGCIRG